MFDQLEALKIISVGQLNAGKKTWVKNIRFKNTCLNFFEGYILPGCRVLWMKNNGKRIV